MIYSLKINYYYKSMFQAPLKNALKSPRFFRFRIIWATFCLTVRLVLKVDFQKNFKSSSPYWNSRVDFKIDFAHHQLFLSSPCSYNNLPNSSHMRVSSINHRENLFFVFIVLFFCDNLFNHLYHKVNDASINCLHSNEVSRVSISIPW